MGLGLGEIHGWIEDFAGGKCIQNFTVVCPSTTLSEVDSETVSKKDLAAYWGSDPVHLTPLGYAKLGEQLQYLRWWPPTTGKSEEGRGRPSWPPATAPKTKN